ncbi:MAG TPA: hypothetical protein VFM37_08010 [Pseudonocardiaceae bacterium]|nr:hypothetical protein [Pseudonocardiaceae bacterium]
MGAGIDGAETAQAERTITVTPVAGPVVRGEYIVTTRPGAAAKVSAAGAAGTTMHVYEHAIHGFAGPAHARPAACAASTSGSCR